MKEPLISIIVPVYNGEKFLKRCIDSILNQSYKNIEVIMIDDGSTDSSKNICQNYISHDKRMIYYFQTNRGVSSARNLGINKMKGDWCCFVDSDDWIEENFLAMRVEKLLSNSYEILFDGYVTESNNGACSSKTSFENVDLSTFSFGEKINYLQKLDVLGYAVTKIFKSEIIKKNSLIFEPDLRLGEDLIFTLRYLRHTKNIGLLPVSLYHYVQHDSNFSRRFVLDYLEQQNKLTLLYCSILEELIYSNADQNILYKMCFERAFRGFVVSLINNISVKGSICQKKKYYDEVIESLTYRYTCKFLKYADRTTYSCFLQFIIRLIKYRCNVGIFLCFLFRNYFRRK